MADPFFSIIIPTYNGADRIKMAIDSCLKQSFNDYEIIVVCDSCTDGTEDLVRDYNDEKIKTIAVSCRRDGLARNAGLDIAKGKYVLFLDDDDWWLHEFVLEMMHNNLEDGTADVLNFGVIWKTKGYRFKPAGSYLPMCAGHAWRREFIGTTRFYDLQYSSDMVFLADMIRKKPVGLWNAHPMYYYNYMRQGSLSDLKNRGEIE